MKQEDKQQNSKIDDRDFDHFFKSNLENYEVQPSQDNWTQIKRWSFLGTFYSIQKKKVLQVAATTLIALTLSLLLYQYSTEVHQIAIFQPSITSPIVVEAELPQVIEQAPTDFVLDIEDEPIDEDVRKEIIEKELDDYLAFLFEDEDEFADSIDSIEISKSLMPAEQLPIDEMFAVIPDLPNSEEITILAPLETRITLPHRFVAEGENIEDYLLLYEINKNRD